MKHDKVARRAIMAKSVEEPVEDWVKKSLDGCGVKHFVKNAADNSGMGVSTMRLLEGSVV
jgi:hypothetical protein